MNTPHTSKEKEMRVIIFHMDRDISMVTTDLDFIPNKGDEIQFPGHEVLDRLVPGEDPLKQEIARNLKTIADLNEENAEIQNRINEKTQFKQLLYETGYPLEDICKLTFKAMDFEIDDSAEDFLLPLEGNTIIVEVKGREGAIPRSDGSQLSQNRRNYALETDRELKDINILCNYLGNYQKIDQ